LGKDLVFFKVPRDQALGLFFTKWYEITAKLYNLDHEEPTAQVMADNEVFNILYQHKMNLTYRLMRVATNAYLRDHITLQLHFFS